MCDFKDDDEYKADRYTDDIAKLRDFEEERAAEEDALCDDPDAKFDIWQGATFTLLIQRRKNIVMRTMETGGKKDKGCNFEDEDEAEEYA